MFLILLTQAPLYQLCWLQNLMREDAKMKENIFTPT